MKMIKFYVIYYSLIFFLNEGRTSSPPYSSMPQEAQEHQTSGLLGRSGGQTRGLQSDEDVPKNNSILQKRRQTTLDNWGTTSPGMKRIKCF